MTTATERRERLKAVYERARVCTDCQLHETRTTVVFGAGKLLDRLLGEIGLERQDVFICNTLKCRPPGNRDPYPNELETCAHYLHSQVQLIQPKVICTLGNFATKLLRGDNTGISRLHGQAEIRTIGLRAVHLDPLYHPAAALYTPSMVETLRADFTGIATLLAADPPPQPPGIPEPGETGALEAPWPAYDPEVELEVTEPGPTQPEYGAPTEPESAAPTEPESAAPTEPDSPEQLGLF